MELVSLAVGSMSLILGSIGIYLSIFYFNKSKEINKKTEDLQIKIAEENEELILNLYSLEYKNQLALLRRNAKEELKELEAKKPSVSENSLDGYWKFKERFEWLKRPRINVSIRDGVTESFYINILYTTLPPFEIDQNILDNEFYICRTYLEEEDREKDSNAFNHEELVCCYFSMTHQQWRISKFYCHLEPEESYRFKITSMTKPQVSSSNDILTSEIDREIKHLKLKDYIQGKKVEFMNKKTNRYR